MLLDGEAIGINLPTPEVLWGFWSRSLVPGEVPELTVQVLRCEHDSLYQIWILRWSLWTCWTVVLNSRVLEYWRVGLSAMSWSFLFSTAPCVVRKG